MKKLAFLTLSILFCLVTKNLSAHALWIETGATGKIGQVQTVKIYYGEYAANERENVSKWYSDVKDFTLWLTGPDQQRTQLKLNADSNSFTSSFTPDKNGSYILEVSHEAKELGGTTKYHFLASANVAVGKNSAVQTKSSNVLYLKSDEINSAKVNQTVKLTATLNNDLAKAKTVSIFSPSGWAKETKTDENGLVHFTPIWPGRYVIEITEFQKVKGDHQGKEYDGIWQGATYSFEVK
ncbi:nickel transport complex protein, NikM subunit, transmembrane [Pedobacter lusitanus]|uniref:Nickel transport complex protein, NikM subunit, transmembrane n=1 Tax=Pedobacter lusitanus TaxID=1503925 RepID=A0A0D0FY09_9SPHI|nr:DUF4198 domain-containing protein [Pedobacter lusitanus]KIO77404.1 nickel transport complex protein, NikM subunit, transmembrane [Pedobacter lusitanus]